MNHLSNSANSNVYCILCGRMTPSQRQIARQRAVIDAQLCLGLLRKFKDSGHPGYENIPIPEECPEPIFVADPEDENNIDIQFNPEVEETFEGGSYHFSSAQDPNENTSVFGSSERFALALLNKSAPTLLACGGSYARAKELPLESVLPFAFPYGLGGPKMDRRTKVSMEVCLRHYLRLSLSQFMRGDSILVINHMFNRQISLE